MMRILFLLMLATWMGCADTVSAQSRQTLLKWSGDEAADEAVDAEPEVDEITTDRPDFTEASSTVGLGRLQIESGYTFIQDRDGGATRRIHSFPEVLTRVGIVRDWLELRLGQNVLLEHGPGEDALIDTRGGADDFYAGFKVFFAEQQEVLPELALVLQTTIPTGDDEVGSGQLLPGLNLLYGWDLTDRISFAGSTQGNRAQDDTDQYFMEFAQSVTTGVSLTDKWGAYSEFFGIFPSGSNDPAIKPVYFYNGGMTYKVTINFQLDVRAGVGLNRAADDFFAGAGASVRF